MSDQLNSSNEEGSIRRVTRSRACVDPPASEPRKTRQSVDRDVLSQSLTVTSSPRRPIRASRRLSTDTHEDTPPAIRSLRNRRVSVDRESATGTPKLVEDSSENESKPLLRRSRRLSVERETATSTPTKRIGLLEPVSENAEKLDEEEEHENISPVAEQSIKKTASPAPSSPSIRKRIETMVGNFIDKIPIKRHSFSLNSDTDSDAGQGKARNGSPGPNLNKTMDKNFKLDTNETPNKKLAKEEPVEQPKSPKKTQLDRFLNSNSVAPSSRHSLPNTVDQEEINNSGSLNRTLDKNFRNRNPSESSEATSNNSPEKSKNTEDKDQLSTSLSLDDEMTGGEEERNSPKKKTVHTFVQRTVTTRHSIVTSTSSGSAVKRNDILNKSMDKNFKSSVVTGNEEPLEPMDVSLVASSEDEDDDEASEEKKEESVESVKATTPGKASPKSDAKNTSLGVSPRKSLKAFREESSSQEEDKSSNEKKDQGEKSSSQKSPKPTTPAKNRNAKDDANVLQDKQEESAEVKSVTPVKKSPKKGTAIEVVPKDEEDEEDVEDEDENEEGSDDEDDDSSDDGSVCEFEMEDVLEDVQEDDYKGSSDDDDDEDEEDEEKEEEDVVINTRKLKNDEPATKVSDILNKCQSFLQTKKQEKRQQHEVDEEKRERKKALKEAKKKKKEAAKKAKEEALARQKAQMELIKKHNKEAQAAAKKKTPEQRKHKEEAKEVDQPNTAGKSKPKKEKKFEQEIIQKLGDLYASNMMKKSDKNGKKRNQSENEENSAPGNSKKKLKILQSTTSASEMAATLQRTKQDNKSKNTQDDYVVKKKPELIPDKKYHQLAKEQKKEQNRLKEELKRQQGKPLKAVVKEPLRTLPKPMWNPAGNFEVEDLQSPVKQKKNKGLKRRLAATGGTDFEVEVVRDGVGENKARNFKEQMMHRKDIRREDSHSLLKRRKFK